MKNYFGSVANEPQIRLTRPNDVNSLTQLDLKCYHYPLSLDGWKEILKGVDDTNRVVVMEVGRRAVGFAAYELVEDADSGDSHVEVTRLGVHHNERRKGYGTRLLMNCESGAKRMQADRISILVPEIHCKPGDPDDVSNFLLVNGYKPSGAIQYEYKTMYGDVVDGYYFVKELTHAA